MPGAIVHVSRRLQDVSQHYPTDWEAIGDHFFPDKPVEYLTDQFVTANKANLLSIRELTPLGDDDTPPQIQLKWDADTTYNCSVYGVASPGKWITERNADPALDYETERVIQLTLSLRLRLEYLMVKQRLRDASVMTSNLLLTAANRFDSFGAANSKPVAMMKNIVTQLGYNNGGQHRRPNHIAMTSHVLDAISDNDDFKGRVQFTVIPSGMKGEDVAKMPNGTATLLEAMIGVKPGTIHIGDHVYNGAAEGQTPAYYAFLGPDVIFGYVEKLGLRTYTMSGKFQWSAYPGSPTSIIDVPQYNRGTIPTVEKRAFTVIDPKVIRPELGFLLRSCVDTTNSSRYGVVLNG